MEITSFLEQPPFASPLCQIYLASVFLRQRIKLYSLRRQGRGSGVGVLWICVHCFTKTNYNQWQAYFRHLVLNSIFSHFTDTQTTCNFKKENATFLPPLSHIPILAKIIVIPLFKLLDCRKPKNKPHYLVKRSELIFDKDIYIYRNSLWVSDFYQLNYSLFILLDLLINQLEMLACMTQQRFITGMN